MCRAVPQRGLLVLGAQVVVRVNLQILLQYLACVLILRLRRKIERNPCHPELIRTERGLGYQFCTQPARVQ